VHTELGPQPNWRSHRRPVRLVNVDHGRLGIPGICYLSADLCCEVRQHDQDECTEEDRIPQELYEEFEVSFGNHTASPVAST